MVVSRVSMPPTLTASYPTLMPVSFSYSGASVLTKKSSNALMNELSRTVVNDLVAALPAAPTRWGVSAAPVATRPTVKKSRRVVMNASVMCGRSGALGGGDGRQRAQRLSSDGPRRNLLDTTLVPADV